MIKTTTHKKHLGGSSVASVSALYTRALGHVWPDIGRGFIFLWMLPFLPGAKQEAELTERWSLHRGGVSAGDRVYRQTLEVSRLACSPIVFPSASGQYLMLVEHNQSLWEGPHTARSHCMWFSSAPVVRCEVPKAPVHMVFRGQPVYLILYVLYDSPHTESVRC